MLSMFSLSIKEILVSGTLLASILGAYFGGQLSTDAKISEVRQDVAVQDAEQMGIAEDVTELKRDVDKLDDKLNALLIKEGISPSKFEPQMSIATTTYEN